jgi:hypothetical protein
MPSDRDEFKAGIRILDDRDDYGASSIKPVVESLRHSGSGAPVDVLGGGYGPNG